MSVYDYLNTTDFTTLRNLMLSSVPADLDVNEGSFLYNAVTPIALFASSMFEMMKVVLDESTLATATGTNLDNIGRTKPRVYRNEATRELIVVKYIPTSGKTPTIPTTTMFTTADGTEYRISDDEDAIEGYFIKCESVAYGPQGTAIDVEVEPNPAVKDVSSFVISGITATGQDAESDEEYRFRIWRAFSQPFAGTVSDYYKKIFSDFKSSPSGFNIEHAIVIPRGSYNGLITIIASKATSPSHLSIGEIQNLENYFDEKIDGVGGWGASIAPIGHVVKVRDFNNYQMPFRFVITVRSGSNFQLTDQIKQTILRASKAYLHKIIDDSWPSANKYNDQLVRDAIYKIYYYTNQHEYAVTSALYGIEDIDPEAVKIQNVTIQKRVTESGSTYYIPQPDDVISSSIDSAYLPYINEVDVSFVTESV